MSQAFGVVIEETDHNFSAYVPDLPGCVATGPSREQVLVEIRDAIALHLEGLAADAQPQPPVRSSVATDAALDAARALTNPGYIAMVSGPNPIVMECSAADGQALQAIADRVAALPGITDVDLHPYHAIIKESFVWCGADED